MARRSYRKRKVAKAKKRTLPPRRESLILTFRPVQRGVLPSIEFDMGQLEHASIGYAVVHWAFLEWAMLHRSKLFARRAKMRLPKDAHDHSFAKRMRVLRGLIGVVLKDPKRRKWWYDMLSKIGKENGVRQIIVHGLWSYDPRRPERLFSSPRYDKGARLTPFTTENIFGFGRRVGELAYALLEPAPGVGRPAPLPDGFYAYASRSFRLRMAGKDVQLGFPQPIPVTPTSMDPSQVSLLEKLKTKAN